MVHTHFNIVGSFVNYYFHYIPQLSLSFGSVCDRTYTSPLVNSSMAVDSRLKVQDSPEIVSTIVYEQRGCMQL